MTEPYATGLLDTGDGNLVYWETSGNPAGIPVVMVHGGPGIPLGPGSRRAFDPVRHRIVVFHQRNCGLSLPHASSPAASMSLNTTAHLVSDMELLREHLGVDRWIVHGGSWGSTLALAYAQAHPSRVSGLMLVAVMTCAWRELEWLYRGVGLYFPEAWERFSVVGGGLFRSPRDSSPPISSLLSAYSSLLEDSDRVVRARAASAWVAWENAFISLESNGRPDFYDGRSEDFKIAFARICAHYFARGAFLEDGVLMRDVHRLAGIPGILIHGRMDMSLPVITVWELARAWGAGAELIVVDDAGHTGSPALRELQQDARERMSAMVS